jgi:pectinesterase
LYSHSLRQFYRDCTVYGTVYFVFTATLFQNCNLVCRKPLEAQHNTVTAQSRTSPDQNTGFSFQDCSITAAPELAGPNNQPVQSFLGRPWKDYSPVVFIETYMTDVIDAEGWVIWNGTNLALDALYYGECKSFGPGRSFTYRVRLNLAPLSFLVHSGCLRQASPSPQMFRTYYHKISTPKLNWKLWKSLRS